MRTPCPSKYIADLLHEDTTARRTFLCGPTEAHPQAGVPAAGKLK